jgi:hypothetical protein
MNVIRIDRAALATIDQIVETCPTPCALFIAGCSKDELAGIARAVSRKTNRVVSAEGTHIFVM